MRRRSLGAGLVILAVLLAGILLYQQFLAPDTTVVTRVRATNAARRAFIESDWHAALTAIEEGSQTLDGDDWELLTWQAVLLEKLGQPSAAVIDRALARGTAEDVWITYGMVALLADEPELALTAGESLMRIAPERVQGYYLIAQAYDALDQVEDALAFYEQTLSKTDEAEGAEAIYLATRQRVTQINISLLEDEIICCD